MAPPPNSQISPHSSTSWDRDGDISTSSLEAPASNEETSTTPEKEGSIVEAPTFVDAAETELDSTGDEDAVPKHGRLLPLRQFLTVYCCLSVSVLLSSLDQTIVASVLPQIANGFESASQISWVGTSFLLTSTAFSPMYGRLADTFGRKSAMLAAMIIMTGGTILCAASPTMNALIIGRAIAGIGGGGCLSMVHIIISDVVSLRARGKYHGILGSLNGAGSVMGPLVGGALGGSLGWRYCFYIELPILGVAVLAMAFCLPSGLGKPERAKVREKFKTLDYMGITLLVSFMVFACLAINLGSKKVTGVVTSFATAAGLIFLAFVYHQAYVAKQGIMPPSMFKNATIDMVFYLNFAFGWVFFSSLYYLPIFFQVVNRQTVLQSSTTLLPFVVTSIIFSTISGVATSFTGNYKISLILAYASMLAASFGMATMSVGTHHAVQVVYMLLLGIGCGCQMQNSLVACQSATPKKDIAVVTSIRNYFRSSGGVFGLTISGAIFNVIMRRELDVQLADELPQPVLGTIAADPLAVHSLLNLSDRQRALTIESYLKALLVIFWVFVPFVSAALISAVLIPEYDLNRTAGGNPVRRVNMFRRLKRRWDCTDRASESTVGEKDIQTAA